MATVTSVLEGMRVKSTKTVLVVLRLTSTSAGVSPSGRPYEIPSKLQGLPVRPDAKTDGKTDGKPDAKGDDKPEAKPDAKPEGKKPEKAEGKKLGRKERRERAKKDA